MGVGRKFSRGGKVFSEGEISGAKAQRVDKIIPQRNVIWKLVTKQGRIYELLWPVSEDCMKTEGEARIEGAKRSGFEGGARI